MAEVVAVALLPHILMAPTGVEERAERVISGMREIGSQVLAAKPDVIVIVSNDHLFNLDLAPPAAYQIGLAAEYWAFGDMDIPREPAVPGQVDFAKGLLASAQAAGLDVAALGPVCPDHGVMIPMLFVNPARTIPIVPVYVNYHHPSVPEPAESWQLGEFIGEYIRKERPAGERVAILGTGGLSHWVGYDGHGVNETFDRAFLADIAKGKGHEWAAKTSKSIEEQAGNGGLEISNMLAAVAAGIGSVQPDGFSFYEPMPEWMTGMGGMVQTAH